VTIDDRAVPLTEQLAPKNKLRRVWCASLLVLITILAPEGFAHGSQKESVSFTYYQRVIFVEGRINNVGRLLFLIDTGASASAVDLKTAERLKLPRVATDKVEGTAGSIDVRTVRIDSVSIGSARAKKLTIPAYDLSNALATPNRHLDAILGYDFLHSFSVRIDFVNQQLIFSSKSTGNLGIPINFELDNGIPRLRGTLNDTLEVYFRLDTGASIFETKDVYLNITEGTWERLRQLDPALRPERYFTGSGVGGEIKLPVARIKNLSAGKAHISSPFVIVQPKAGYFARPDAAGFVSNNLLEKFSPVTIDYRRRTLYLSAK
jgi:predicted aspartyl protease